jgi:hypothetical protein
MNYCITIEQLNGSPKTHTVHYFQTFEEAMHSFQLRCDELGYYATILNDENIAQAGGIGHDFRLELIKSTFSFLQPEI